MQQKLGLSFAKRKFWIPFLFSWIKPLCRKGSHELIQIKTVTRFCPKDMSDSFWILWQCTACIVHLIAEYLHRLYFVICQEVEKLLKSRTSLICIKSSVNCTIAWIFTTFTKLSMIVKRLSCATTVGENKITIFKCHNLKTKPNTNLYFSSGRDAWPCSYNSFTF